MGWESPWVRACSLSVTTTRGWTPGALPATVMTTRRARPPVPAWERVAWKRVRWPPARFEARVVCATTARARGCKTAGLGTPGPYRRVAWASIPGLTSGEAQWRSPRKPTRVSGHAGRSPLPRRCPPDSLGVPVQRVA